MVRRTSKKAARKSPPRKRKEEAKTPASRKRLVRSSRTTSASTQEFSRQPKVDPPRTVVVAIGASAGGPGAIATLLGEMPPDIGIAFVVVQHQERAHSAELRDLIARSTALQVEEVNQDTTIEPNRVYVAPSEGLLRISGETLFVIDSDLSRAARLPIDYFFRSLAENYGSAAMGVLLSGNAPDGAAGLNAIKAEAGITFAQDESARFPGMPRHAISLGSVDMVAPPAEIAAEIVRLVRSGFPQVSTAVTETVPLDALTRVFSMLQTAHGIDFTHYKANTVERRIRRRMALAKSATAQEYVERLQNDGEELEKLYQDMLIRVTGFFRDPEVFRYIEDVILPKILAGADPSVPIRIWVPGCSTGEEAYSIAICLQELMSKSGDHFQLQIFGTDVSEMALDKARAGIYPENIAADVSGDRLRRFFGKVDGHYRISKSIRDVCIFARQNITRDPSFSRLDLISCRNVLIYLGANLQQRAMSIFHYSLKPEGYLLLGNSETVGRSSDLFKVVDRNHKIFQKIQNASRSVMDFSYAFDAPARAAVPGEELRGGVTNLFKEVDRLLLSRYSPPGVLVNDQLQILQFRGKTSSFLEPPQGAASLDVLRMTREGLLADVRTALHNARKSGKNQKRDGVLVRLNGHSILVDVEVLPLTLGSNDRYYLISFSEQPAVLESPKRGRRGAAAVQVKHVERLKRELDATRDYLQSIIEEQEATNEELRLANEEIQSSNEELQSTNEELETAKEELQSSNEELTTLNEELENRNEQLAQVNNDLINLLNSIDIPIVMLGSDLRIRRFNPIAQRMLRLISSDVGRPIGDLKTRLKLDNLEELVMEVIESLRVKELDVEDEEGRTFFMRIRPYKTTENRIDGAVIAAIDVEQLRKQTQDR